MSTKNRNRAAPSYAPPVAISLNKAAAGQGFVACAPGSGDSVSCSVGNVAQGSGCTGGLNASFYGCGAGSSGDPA